MNIKSGDWTVSVGGIVNAYYTAVSGAAVGGLALGACYSLNSLITLAGDARQIRSKSFGGLSTRMNGVSLGGIIFF